MDISLSARKERSKGAGVETFYRAVAKRSEASADAISAQAGRVKVQAQALRDAAVVEEQQAQTRDAEATQLLAQATEVREEAARLHTETDALIARAEALAADYRALASNPPSVRVVTQYLYDLEGRLLGEYDEKGHVQREYVYLEGMPLALMASSGIYYYHTDHLSTPQSLTDSDQTVVWQANHDPFGRASVTTQAVVNNLRFPGQYFDAETGLHYNYYRDYDPAVGRYIQSDLIGLAGGINTYAYAGGNPLSFADPYGLFVDEAKFAELLSGVGNAGSKAALGLGSAVLTGVSLGLYSPAAGEGSDFGRGERCKCKEVIYRVFGQHAPLYGRSWTPVNPTTIPNYRDSAGLPYRNHGKYLATGCLIDDTGVNRTTASSLDGNQGGLPEYIIPAPQKQIEIIDVRRITPPL